MRPMSATRGLFNAPFIVVCPNISMVIHVVKIRHSGYIHTSVRETKVSDLVMDYFTNRIEAEALANITKVNVRKLSKKHLSQVWDSPSHYSR